MTSPPRSFLEIGRRRRSRGGHGAMNALRSEGSLVMSYSYLALRRWYFVVPHTE